MNITLSHGCTGDEVAQLQHLLNNIGFYLDVDGIYGDETQAVVEEFQSTQDLDVDGVVGPMTWNALEYVMSVGAGC